MPEVTTCPECEKKLKVPDDLLGKKVRCPGCSVMFTAKTDGAEEPPEEEAPAKPPREKASARADGISARKREAADEDKPRARARADEEDEPPRAEKRRAEEDEEDDRPTAKKRRDEDEDEDDRPTAKKRRDEDEDDRPRGGIRRKEDVEDRPVKRSRDDEEDDRRRSRRDEDEDYPRPARGASKGWNGTRIGVFLVIIANWLHLTGLGIGAVGMGTMLLMGGAFLSSLMSGGQVGEGSAAAAGGLLVLGVIFMILFYAMIGIGGILQLVGQGICIQVPHRQGSAMRGLAIAAFACAVLALLLNVGGFAIGTRGGGGQYTSSLSGLLNTAAFVCWVLFLRCAAVELRDNDLGGKFLTYLIGYIIFVVVAVILLIVTVCGGMAAVGTSAAKGTAESAAATGGAMMVIMVIFGGLVALVYLGLTVWYVMLLQRLRALIGQHIGR